MRKRSSLLLSALIGMTALAGVGMPSLRSSQPRTGWGGGHSHPGSKRKRTPSAVRARKTRRQMARASRRAQLKAGTYRK